MNVATLLGQWSSRLAILVPIAGALIQYQLREWAARERRIWLSIAVVGSVGVFSLLHFHFNRQLSCMFTLDVTNCFVSGLGSLSAIILMGAIMALMLRRLDRQPQSAEINHLRLLLFVAAFSGVTVGENLIIVIIALIVLFSSLDYWLRHRGLRWGFLVVRDDYKDDIGK